MEDLREEAELNVEQIPEGKGPLIIYARGALARIERGGGNPGESGGGGGGICFLLTLLFNYDHVYYTI